MRVKLLAATLVITTVSLTFADNLKHTFHQQFGTFLATAEAHSVGTGHTASEHAAGGHEGGEQHAGEHHAKHTIVVTSPAAQDVVLTQQYVCQIHSRRHIDIRALEGGYLKEIPVKEGQQVKEGELMFHILPTLYEARLNADLAEVQLARVEYDNTSKLVDQQVISVQELKLAKAKLDKAQAKVDLAKAELNFANIRAPFDGIIDRLYEQQGSLIEEGTMLTTLSDNEVMWVYFNVPEVRYLEYQAGLADNSENADLEIQLVLANHKLFPHTGTIGAIEADFNNETGNIAFRADFPNPERLLRHGQTGTVLINRLEKGAIVVPQRATFEILAKKYAYVVDENDIVHQREVVIGHEKDDIFIIENGLAVSEKIVLEGILQVRDGEKIEYEYREPTEVLADLKYHAE